MEALLQSTECSAQATAHRAAADDERITLGLRRCACMVLCLSARPCLSSLTLTNCA